MWLIRWIRWEIDKRKTLKRWNSMSAEERRDAVWRSYVMAKEISGKKYEDNYNRSLFGERK